MNVEEILDMLDEMIDRAWNLPMTGGRCVLDADKVRDLIDDIRANMPPEIAHAKKIVADRAEIIAEAKREAETIVRRAEERAKALTAQEEIMRQSQQKAQEMVTQAQMKSREMRQAAQEFADKMLKNTEEGLAKSLMEVKSTRQALRNAKK
ncbi:ATPase [Hydrogenoanaerobacterium sp.]|uniref:ATPase n=1 Tax=Hydrogenoanaerobacterium sp. TaxID=2953763 RepID=UPI00289BEBE9|nr:ATPase [Hydrogenoanaerobacterium sp.]